MIRGVTTDMLDRLLDRVTDLDPRSTAEALTGLREEMDIICQTLEGLNVALVIIHMDGRVRILIEVHGHFFC